MKKMTSQSDEVRGLCRQINKEVNRGRLQNLVGRLQQALREEQSPTHYQRSHPTSRCDSPYDKVLMC
jgi:hypothetical protein